MANSARIDELRKKFDENPRRYFAPLANEYRKSGDLPQAVFILEEYLPQQPGHISGHIVYGQTLFELGRDEEAKRVFEAALSLDPENLIALRHLGHISRQAGDFDAARSWYQRLLEADPRDAEIEQLLGSLDAAAQAHAAGLTRPPTVESAPLPPPMPEVDDSPLQVEHLVQQDAPGAPPRAATHPLAPPPLPLSAEPAAATPDATLEPPPLPSAPVGEAREVEARGEEEHAEELLDLNDFSFDLPASAGVSSPPAQLPSARADDESARIDDDTSSPAPTEVPSHEDVSTSASTVEANVSPAEPSEPIPPDVPVGFEPFSGLAAHETEPESESVSGFESYEFESPQGPVAEVSDDVGSFYMEASDTTPTPAEAAEHGQVFESIDEDLAAHAVAREEQQFEEPDVQAESSDQIGGAAAVDESATTQGGDETDVAARATMPIASTPVIAEPAARTPATPIESAPVAPVTATTPESAPVAASSATPTTPPATATAVPDPFVADEGDAFATETMAKLYLSQGHLESALGIYRTLSAKHPDDASLQRQVEEIEDRVQRRRREPPPPAPVEALAVESMPAGRDETAEEPVPQPRPGAPTIRDFLLGIIRRGSGAVGSEEHATSAPNGGTIDALFDGGSDDALDDDLVAADTLSQAFAPEPARDPMHGHPAREAATELSLDRVFRQPTPAHAGEGSVGGGFSFDQFFAGERTGDADASPPSAPTDPDDIEQFNAWLNGLKKS